jgi:hypothetical protein
MTIATQGDLVTAVSNWLYGRTDLAARVPEFITLFEAKANRTLFCRQMEVRSVVTLDTTLAESEFIALPWDFQTMRRVRLVNAFSTTNGVSPEKPRLRFATGAQMDDLRDKNPAPNVPIWFTVFGSEIELCPKPDFNYLVEMVYRQNIPALNTTPTINGVVQPLITTNWLLTFAPDAYLYGTLMEAAPYLRDDERIPTWKAGVDGVIAELNRLSDEATYNAGPLVMRRGRRGY